jgi:pSer/pThr/pTyr-binding forkhead associated (FHA) protein
VVLYQLSYTREATRRDGENRGIHGSFSPLGSPAIIGAGHAAARSPIGQTGISTRHGPSGIGVARGECKLAVRAEADRSDGVPPARPPADSSERQTVEVRFVILSTSGKPRTSIKRLPLLVGRADEAKLRVVQDCVSRRHCEFVERDGDVFIRDLKSTNGTMLDGELIPPDVDTLVKPGSIVKVGGAKFRVEYGPAGTTAAATEPSADAAVSAEKDTVPLEDASAADVAAAEKEPPVLEPAGDETVGPDAAEVPPADGSDFGFLGAASASAADAPAADATGEQWPVTSDAPAPPDDGDLNDFFKSLS